MPATPCEIEFEFEKVICTDLLLRYPKIDRLFEKLLFQKSGFIWEGINSKIEGTKTVRAIRGIRAIWVRASEIRHYITLGLK